MSNKKQTAVDFFFEKIKSHFKGDDFEDLVTTMAIAKQKEKEQMKDALLDNVTNSDTFRKLFEKNFEQYYIENYKP